MRISKTLHLVIMFLLVMPILGTAQQPTPAPTGKLFDAGGHLLHLNIQGKGGPAVVMENGSGDFSFIWGLVQPAVAKFTTAVSYDRAGYAWSEPGPYPRSARQIAFELHTALHNAGIKPPYILVGQSYGGFLVRHYALYYPDEVAGIVLVEALNENARIIIGDKPMRIREWATGRQAPPPQVTQKKDAINSATQQSATTDTALDPLFYRLPKNVQDLQRWAQTQPQYRVAGDSEMTFSPNDVANLYANRGKPGYTLGNMPLIVLTRGSGGYDGRADSAELEDERLQQQEQLAQLSTNSKHIIDKNSGHNIHVEDPGVVIAAIKEVWEAAKGKRRVR